MSTARRLPRPGGRVGSRFTLDRAVSRPKQSTSWVRIAAAIVLGVEIAASTGYLVIFVLVVGVWTWLYQASPSIVLSAALIWVGTVAGAVTLIWMIFSMRRFWSRGGAVANVVWTSFMLATGVVGYPLSTLFALLGLVASVLLLVVALQERQGPSS